MRIPKLQMTSQFARLGVRKTPENFEIKNPPPSQLNMETEPGRLEMHTEQVKVLIDQTQCFDESGLKSNASLIEDNASYGKQMAMRGISRMVDQGNRLADISAGNPMPEQAQYNAFGMFKSEFGMVTMPKSRPEFTVVGGTVDINVTRARVLNNTQVQAPSISFTPAKIEIYLEQENRLDISVIDEEV